jgi:thymidylate synthase (FAD)
METNNFEKIKRTAVSELDSILGNPFTVLNDGFVRVVDYMGSDESIVQAARVSYGKGTKKLSEDRGLIRYLLRNQHTTPFEMCEIKLHVRVPMDCWRQWIRHRTANVNEYSTRYSLAIDSTQKTKKNEWRSQSPNNKQGSGYFLNEDIGGELSRNEEEIQKQIWNIYEDRISKGVAREQARKDLPLSTYTEAYWKTDLHNLFHFLKLRMDDHAQFEIRNYANIIGNEIVKKWCPLAWEAFEDYQLSSMKLSKIEIEIFKMIYNKETENLNEYLKKIGFLNLTGEKKKSREKEEIEKKLISLNITIPW